MELFPFIPRDVGLQCLLRVHYKSHYNLTSVCRSWEAAVNNPEFYERRKQIGTSEQIICLFMEFLEYGANDAPKYAVIVYDRLQGTWEMLPNIPHFPGCYHKIPQYIDCVSINQMLVFVRGI